MSPSDLNCVYAYFHLTQFLLQFSCAITHTLLHLNSLARRCSAAFATDKAMSQSSKGKRPAVDGSPAQRKRKRSRFSNVDLQTETQAGSISNGPSSKWAAAMDIESIPVAPVATLRINRDKALEKRVKGKLKVSADDLLDEDPETNPYFDPDITVNTETRRAARPGLKFHEQGKIAARADKLRAKAEEAEITAQYRERIAARAAQNSSVPELPPYIAKRQPYASDRAIPAVEWWDAPFVLGDSYLSKNGMDVALNAEKLNVFIHHPKNISPSIPDKPPPVLPLMLTEKERKKLRRKNRQEALKEEQEMISVGLLPTPPPKVKLSNMMRVLANEVTADPTRMEMQVRKQANERKIKHIQDNENRRRTKDERHERILEKQEKDREAAMAANVYRVTNADNPQHRFKVVMNARQLGLSGALVLFDDCNVVVVEGGTKSLAKFRKLMLRRIDWSILTPPNADGSGPSEMDIEKNNKKRKYEAVLVWEGSITKAAFHEFKTVETKAENSARLFFRKRRVEHYWDLCVQASPPGDESLGVRTMD